jgi:lipopolysaccharide/colanic/teichoic acid biosynthesis glycosyltransferase
MERNSLESVYFTDTEAIGMAGGEAEPLPVVEPSAQLTLTHAAGLDIAWRNGVPVTKPTHSEMEAMAKRLTDILLSLLALVVLGPALLLTAALIRLTRPGPAIFRQHRIGLHGTRFEIYKFRTMRLDRCEDRGDVQVTADDDRVTPIGRLLRRYSIDELPQLLNVLQGEMSLVGPRPYVPGMRANGRLYCHLAPYFSARYEMKPGLTGWAQANGLRGPTGSDELARRRLDFDIAYIQNFSLALDLKIIVLTVWNEIRGGSGL